MFNSSTFYSLFNWLLLLGYWLLIAGVTVRILMKRRAVASTMAWLLIIYILPLVGIIAYFSLGELHLGRQRAERAKLIWPVAVAWLNQFEQAKKIFAHRHSKVASALFDLCACRQGFHGVRGNRLQLIADSQGVLQQLIQDINAAQHNVEMVFYIWQPGGLVEDVAQAFMAAAQRGVHCRLMLDSAGSVRFFHSYWPKRMRAAGIEVVEALKVSLLRVFLRRMDLRQHRKVILIDGHIAYTGSMNMVDARFFKRKAGVGQWVDLMARMEGPVTSVIGIVYASDWEIETGKRILPHSLNHTLVARERESEHNVQIIASGPGFTEDAIHHALLTAIYSARQQLVMTTPYFIPSEDLLNAINLAALRGVEVTIIIPRRNDSLLVGWASRAFFAEMLDSGVKIYLFNGGLLHSKSVLVDGQLSLIGTVNLDIRSLWLNFEITLVVDDAEFARDLFQVQSSYIRHSTRLDAKKWAKRAIWQRVIERLFYFFSPLL